MAKTYKVIRFYRDGKPNKVIKRGLCLEAAQEHCKSEETHKVEKSGDVVWFDGYNEE